MSAKQSVELQSYQFLGSPAFLFGKAKIDRKSGFRLWLLRDVTRLAARGVAAAFEEPDQDRQKHGTSGSPSDGEEFVAAMGFDTNVTAIFVDGIGSLDDEGGDESARDAEGEESDCGGQDVDKGGDARGREQAHQTGNESNKGETDADTVENECGLSSSSDGAEGLFNVIGPLQVVESDVHTSIVE